METFTVQAVYKKGVLKPKTRLNLPEDTEVEVQIKAVKSRKGEKPTLFGAFPELSSITNEDMQSVKKHWEKGLAKQERMLKRGK